MEKQRRICEGQKGKEEINERTYEEETEEKRREKTGQNEKKDDG